MTPQTPMIGQAPQATSLLPDKWIKRIMKWVIVVVVLILVITRMQGCAETQKKKEAQAADATARAQAPVEITLNCGGDKDYVPLPADKTNFVLTVNPTGENCWTPWIVLPEVKLQRPNIYDGNPEGDLEAQLAVRDGKILDSLHISPREKPWNPRSDLKAVRYKNPEGKPVKISVTLFW